MKYCDKLFIGTAAENTTGCSILETISPPTDAARGTKNLGVSFFSRRLWMLAREKP